MTNFATKLKIVNTPEPELVLIDLDGTLINTTPDLGFCVNQILDMMGMPLRSASDIQRWIGNGTGRLIHRALTGSVEGVADSETFDLASELFDSLYTKHNGEFSYLYSGVEQGIEQLRAEGKTLGCVTNKPIQFAEPLLEQFGLLEKFAILIGGDSLPEKKPHPMPLLYAAEQFGVRPEESWLIGDSMTDIKAAHAAGFNIACVSYGYNQGVDLTKAFPDLLVDSLTELSGCLMPRELKLTA